MNFDPIKFNYSMKNIPLCNERQYMSKMYNQVYNFEERLRWRASFFKIQKTEEKKHQEEDKNNQTNVFPTRKFSTTENTHLLDKKFQTY